VKLVACFDNCRGILCLGCYLSYLSCCGDSYSGFVLYAVEASIVAAMIAAAEVAVLVAI
jgi:hypothetical protein